MQTDPELTALIEQAARNLDALRLLVRQVPGHRDQMTLLRQRLATLRAAYTEETDVLTRQVLKRAIDRRRGPERRLMERRRSSPPRESATAQDD
jgi:hypothetical protein